MAQSTRAADGSVRWIDSSVTINANDCKISIFQPSVTALPATPDRPLHSIEDGIKDEPSTPVSVQRNLLRYPSLQPEVEHKDPFSNRAYKEESEEVDTYSDQRAHFYNFDRATAQAPAASGIAQLRRFACDQATQRSGHEDSIHVGQRYSPAAAAGLANDNVFGPDGFSSAEDALSLLEDFGVKRNAPRSSASITPPSAKRIRLSEPYSMPDPPGLVTPIYSPENQAEVSETNFYRQHSEQLPRKKRYGKAHEWTFEQREALCLMYIFYETDNEFQDIAQIMNAYFQTAYGESFRPGQLRAQWGTWRYIFRKRPVYDPEREWVKKRAGYEAAAASTEVALRLRAVHLKEKRLDPKYEKVTETVANNDAWFLAKLIRSRGAGPYDVASPNASPLASRSSRDVEDNLLQQLSDAAELGDTPSLVESSPAQASSEKDELPNTPVRQDSNAGSDSDPPTPYRPGQTSAGYAAATLRLVKDTTRTRPALLYRVYHDESGGLNAPTKFRAGLFNIPGQSLEPPPQDKNLFPVFVSWHLWHHSVSSPFISCTDSLIMAMHKARQAEADGLNPHIAIIDAGRAMADGRGFPALPLVSQARKRGLVPGMRYKALREHLVWGEIGADAIVHDLPLDALRCSTAASDMGVADLLGLDDIDPAPQMSVARIRRALLRQEVVLDGGPAAGHVVGRLAALFGLGPLSAPPMVEQFVFDFFQGWVLGAAGVPEMASGFLAGLGDAEVRAGGALAVLDAGEESRLREAFVGGVERAQDDLKKERRLVRR